MGRDRLVTTLRTELTKRIRPAKFICLSLLNTKIHRPNKVDCYKKLHIDATSNIVMK